VYPPELPAPAGVVQEPPPEPPAVAPGSPSSPPLPPPEAVIVVNPDPLNDEFIPFVEKVLDSPDCVSPVLAVPPPPTVQLYCDPLVSNCDEKYLNPPAPPPPPDPPPPPPAITNTSATMPAVGVTEALSELAKDVPLAFVAVTVKVYAVPFVKPETVIGDDPVPVRPPGLDVAVYVAEAPPVAPGV